MNRKKKIAASVSAVILVLALGLAGTFAKVMDEDSDNDVSGTIQFTPILHDDFDQGGTPADPSKRDRDVFVENAGETSIYVRVRMDEFMTYANQSIIAGATQSNLKSWTPHLPAGNNVARCKEKFHKYFTWELGNDTTVKYTSKIKNRHNLQTGEVIADDKDTDKAKVITMEAYMKAVEDNTVLDPCWIMDTDGYAYWYQPLEPDKATGLLLNQINVLGTLDDDYFYGINVKMEALTDIDLSVWFDGKQGFNRSTQEAEMLLKNISPNYIRITDDMELTSPKASAYDKDGDGYLTSDEYAEYQKLNPTISLTDASAFPDADLRAALAADPDVDANHDGALTTGEREAVNVLDLSNKGISDLTGIDKFTKVTDLNVSGNHLTKLNLSKNTMLTTVNASGQTANITLDYIAATSTYQTKANVFGVGTTFGVSGVAYDNGNGIAVVDNSVNVTNPVSYTAPVTFGKAVSSVNLEGQVTFKRNLVVGSIMASKAGDVVEFPDSSTPKNKTQWIILTKDLEKGEAVLISKDQVTARQYHTTTPYPSWEASSIKTWLNGAYKATLNADMKLVLKAETLKTAKAYNDWAPANMTTSSDNEVYLLTESAENSGKVSKNPGEDPIMTTAQMKCALDTMDGTTDSGSNFVTGQSRWWWLRSPRVYSSNPTWPAGNVGCSDGSVSPINVTYTKGVRPAVTIKLK